MKSFFKRLVIIEFIKASILTNLISKVSVQSKLENLLVKAVGNTPTGKSNDTDVIN